MSHILQAKYIFMFVSWREFVFDFNPGRLTFIQIFWNRFLNPNCRRCLARLRRLSSIYHLLLTSCSLGFEISISRITGTNQRRRETGEHLKFPHIWRRTCVRHRTPATTTTKSYEEVIRVIRILNVEGMRRSRIGIYIVRKWIWHWEKYSGKTASTFPLNLEWDSNREDQIEARAVLDRSRSFELSTQICNKFCVAFRMLLMIKVFELLFDD